MYPVSESVCLSEYSSACWRGTAANAAASKYGDAFRQNKGTGGKAAEESRAF
jgi:hypothetical protein